MNRWTAEEGRHAFCIRDYLLVTRGVDPEELERARMQTMETGFDSGNKPLLTDTIISSALLGRVGVGALAGAAGAGPNGQEGMEFAEDGVKGQAGAGAFGS